ncbi:uncharacterized protein FOMMEDRAFT_128196 [Fomitiporia mediterranea MF3/22]|uniref:uncharacterized protein n=1 Tax=Fomitiporia mediterranea (strain MF3/22) TaxID=694068 RepID=UPI0004409990|nr:uncharacterized protein FOMMEDRAFT_128196 [Fomitiporia mediterranea MF3/22]EJC99124.1 hypothetical protein FOMMEDRAFT_128196 [Fomitiporia mediterranea MF3/22]
MMVPPSTARDRGVRDTPYPTPPGSTSEHQHPHSHPTPHQGYTPVMGLVPNGYGAHHAMQAPVLPATGVESSPVPGGLISRFHNIYHRSHNPTVHPVVEEKEAASSSPTRGRARERRKKEPKTRLRGNGNGHVHEHGHGHTRSHSVDSDASCSSVSTYYVIPTPGQKVRIIRTDGQTVTTTTSVSRNASAGGWLKKAAALRPRFLHRDRDESAGNNSPVKEKDAQAHESHDHDTPTGPVAARTPSGGSDKSKKKGSRKLVRRNSTGAPVLLSNAQEQEEKVVVGADHDHGRSRDVDIVFPGQ